ncbi:MAG TPA: hypothetical protein VG713_16440 [Pirellulales bacterium]|nr:hypothetical protein [Pirellulales bacterium]
MRKNLLPHWLVIVALAVGTLASARPAVADMKPMVVVAFSGYNELHKDLEYIGKISDVPELGNSLDGMIALLTQFQGLVGLDKSKPWGAAVSSDGQIFQTVAFLPVTDTKKLLGALQGMVGEPQDAGDGVQQIRAGAMPLFLKEKNGWAFIAQMPDQLADLPADPQTLISSLTKTYDLAVRINAQNIPQQFRDLAINQIKLGMQSGLDRQADETDAQYQVRVKLMQQQIDQLVQLINELDELLIGWAIDAQNRLAFLDISMTAVPGSKLAANAAAASVIKSKFTGFLENEDAVIDAHVASKQGDQDIATTVATIQSLKSSVFDSIDKSDDLKDDEKPVIKKAVEETFESIEATAKKGVIDGGMVIVGEGPFTIVAGGSVEKAGKLESAFRQAMSVAKRQPDAPEVEYDVDKHAGVTFHSISGPWPDDADENVKQVLGDDIEITVAFGEDRVFVALGEDGVDTIKDVIDDSQSAEQSKLPFELDVWVKPILEYSAEQQPDNPILKLIADTLGDEDGIHLTSRMIPNGALARLEFDEGVLKAIGTAANAAKAGRP